MVDEAINNKLITLWGQGKRKMQYIYIEDVIKHILLSGALPSGVYNLCADNYLSVKETANIIAKHFEAKIKNIEEKPEGETLAYMDNQKIINSLNLNLFSEHIESLNNYLNNLKL